MFETWSDETLPSNDGGACDAGTDRGSIERAAGETGIFGGGVGGTGELLCGPWIDGHIEVEGIVKLGYRFRGVEPVEFLVVGVVILVGRVLEGDMQLSLISVSSSVASYNSSKPDI